MENKKPTCLNYLIILGLLFAASSCRIYQKQRFETISKQTIQEALEFKKTLYLHAENGKTYLIKNHTFYEDSLVGNISEFADIQHKSCKKRLIIKGLKNKSKNHLHLYCRIAIIGTDGHFSVYIPDIQKMEVHEKTYFIPLAQAGIITGLVIGIINSLSFGFSL